jgi:hypothetical protein
MAGVQVREILDMQPTFIISPKALAGVIQTRCQPCITINLVDPTRRKALPTEPERDVADGAVPKATGSGGGGGAQLRIAPYILVAHVKLNPIDRVESVVVIPSRVSVSEVGVSVVRDPAVALIAVHSTPAVAWPRSAESKALVGERRSMSVVKRAVE